MFFEILKSDRAVTILSGVVYILLALAINTALIDIISSLNSRISFKGLDQASRVITAVGISFPITFYLFRASKKFFPFLKYRLIITALFFLMFNGFVTVELRNLINHCVQKTSSTQRMTAIGAVIGINAYSHGVISMSNIGLSGIDKDNITTKVAAVYFIPYLSLTDKLDKITKRSGEFASKLVIKIQNKAQPIIERKLDNLCREGKEAHENYLVKSKEATTGFFVKKKKEYFINFRDETLGYHGSLGLGLGWNEFIVHRDIQMIIREKIAVAISDSILPPQLEYIFPKSYIIQEVIRIFDRKVITPCLNFEEYMLEYGYPLGMHIGKKIDNIVLKVNESDISVGDGFNSVGEKAVYALLVPPIGIMWTLIMSTIAMGLVAYKVINLFHVKKYYPFAAAIILVGTISIMPFFHKNGYANIKSVNGVPGLIKTEYSDYGGSLIAPVFEWCVRYAPIIYPVGYFSREYIVGVFIGLDEI